MNKLEIICVDDDIQIHIDGKLIHYLLDPIEFVLPVIDPIKTQFMFTCSCDVAGCAGWHEGFKVESTPTTIKWTKLDEHQDFHDVVLFDREEYISAQRECLLQLYGVAARRACHIFTPPLEEDEEPRDRFIFGFGSVEELDILLARALEWHINVE